MGIHKFPYDQEVKTGPAIIAPIGAASGGESAGVHVAYNRINAPMLERHFVTVTLACPTATLMACLDLTALDCLQDQLAIATAELERRVASDAHG